MTSKTPHASFINKSKIVRWSIDLRYQDFKVPNNINESPEDYLLIEILNRWHATQQKHILL